jgi:hypothetical protein
MGINSLLIVGSVYRRRFRDWAALRSPGGFGADIGFGSRRRRGKLVEDRLEAAHPGRQREAVALDRLAQQLDERGLFVVVEVKAARH